jgi:hypothetical protein
MSHNLQSPQPGPLIAITPITWVIELIVLIVIVTFLFYMLKFIDKIIIFENYVMYIQARTQMQVTNTKTQWCKTIEGGKRNG